ncbi:MAG: hypothetical protein K6T91_10820 [Firmicutes bacterium]|nr:hypothetical protein [Bacillota bacterium]
MTKKEIIDRLNYLRSKELFAIQQYMNHYYEAKGPNFSEVKGLERSIAIVEMKHAELLAEKITMLGGEPITNPGQVQEMKGAAVFTSESVDEMIRADLNLERNAIQDYTKAIVDIGDTDPGIRKMLEDILGQEEEHADSFGNYLGEQQAYDVEAMRKAA